MSDQLHAPAALPSGKDPGAHSVGSYVGPRARVDDFEEKQNLTPPGFEPCTAQPVANRYTDFSVQVLAHFV